MEDRSALFNQLKNFSQRKLKKVETKVVTASGEQLVEKRGAKGLQVLSGGAEANKDQDIEPPRKLDLQVGLILPGLLIGSQDVAHDKSSLDSYGITHILNLDADVKNKFEDEYNYKNVNIQDKPDFTLDKVFEDCFDFIDDGRHYGNVLVHCAGTIGLSRSTTICIGYLMSQEKQKLDEAFNNVKEARSFVKPNEGFMKQLKEYEVKLRGAQQVKDSGIDDPFALRKKQEIEQEKAMVAGAASVKNRMKMFGATLDTGAGSNSARSKSVSPSPFKSPASPVASNNNNTSTNTSSASSKWGANRDSLAASGNATISKSMTPEPRKSWQQPAKATTTTPEPSSQRSAASGGPPPPPPPMPSGLHANDKSVKPLNSSNKSSLPPPPPPPPPAGDLSKSDSTNSSIKSTSSSNSRNLHQNTEDSKKAVFGRVRPPPMKISGGISIEKNDSVGDRNSGIGNKICNSASILPNRNGNSNAYNPLDNYQSDRRNNNNNKHSLNERCESPLVLFNNQPRRPSARSISSNQQAGVVASTPTPASPTASTYQPAKFKRGINEDESGVYEELPENPFKFWQNTLSKKTANTEDQPPTSGASVKRTVSLGPKRQPLGGESSLRNNPFIQNQSSNSSSQSFNKAAKELQSSLTELNKLIDESPTPRISNKPARFNYMAAIEQSNQSSSQRNNDEQDALLNRRASFSINDLRSVFESKQAEQSLGSTLQVFGTSGRPPRSASPSVLKNSPWQDLANKPPPSPVVQSVARNLSQQPPSPKPPISANYSDYTIRRTNSGNNSQSSRELRNPYRS